MEPPDDHMRSREAERDIALAEVAAALNDLQNRGQPDSWERVHLVYAFFAIFAGCYELGTVEARLALASPDGRSPGTILPTNSIFEHCDLSRLTELLRAAHDEPVQRFPHFGPVELRFPMHKQSGKAWLK